MATQDPPPAGHPPVPPSWTSQPDTGQFTIRPDKWKRFGWFALTLLGAAVGCGGALVAVSVVAGPGAAGFGLLLLVAMLVLGFLVLALALPLLPLPPDAVLHPDGVWIPERPGRRRLMWVPWEQVDRVALHRRGLTWELRVDVRHPHGTDTRTAALWAVNRSPGEIRVAIVRYAGAQRAEP
jgi:hypothetical protein